MAVLTGCKPERVFHYFEEICNIPHPSYKEKLISDYLVDFAKEHKLWYVQDDIYDVIMIKEASEGYEDEPAIIIQGHMDMVAEKESSCEIDMDKEGLKIYIDGDYVTADGTTLGGDDGIAVAYALALLEDESLKHPRIEFVCTVSEEVGMDGAHHIDVSMLKGRRLLNIDSEDEGILTVGCAGGSTVGITYPVERKEVTGARFEVSVSECTGGHSGAEIHHDRANATHTLNRLLSAAVEKVDLCLVSFAGGSKDNAITREAKALVVVDPKDADAFNELVITEAERITSEYAVTDPDMEIDVEELLEGTEKAVDAARSRQLISYVGIIPNGVQRMSHDVEGLVETSLNMGIFELQDTQLSMHISNRSNIDSALWNQVRMLKLFTEATGGEFDQRGIYPAWEYKRESAFRDQLVAIHEEMFGVTPRVEMIHAGLECGLLSKKLEGLDCISIGPQMHDIHTPKERLSISSTERMYNYIRKIIETKTCN